MCPKDSAPEAPEDFLALVSGLVTLQDLQERVAAVLDVGPSLEGPAITLLSVSLPLKGVQLQEPTAASLAVTPPSERVNSQEPIIASPAVIIPSSEKSRPQERISTPSAVATPLLYMRADCTHRPSFLVPILAHVTSFICMGHRVLSVHTLPHSLGSLLFGLVDHIDLQPDVWHRLYCSPSHMLGKYFLRC
jgi:hypothetical protein